MFIEQTTTNEYINQFQTKVHHNYDWQKGIFVQPLFDQDKWTQSVNYRTN